MNTTQLNKLRMFLALQAALLEDRETWKDHEAFAEAAGELTDAILEVEKANQHQIAKDGAVNNKEATMDLLGSIAYEVAGAAFACASRSGNEVLAGRMDYQPSEITTGSHAAIQARCLDILGAAREVAPALVRYGIKPARLELLGKRIEAHHQAQTQPRSKQGDGVAATRELADALARADREVKQQLDRMVGQFQETNPHFVTKYRAARRIVNLAGSGPAAKSPADAETSDKKSTPGIPPGAGPVVPKAA